MFPCPRSRRRIWSCETGSAVPSRVNLLYTEAEYDAYLRNSSRFPRRRPFIYFNRHTPSGLSRVYRVTQLPVDGVHCRQSAGTAGPVNVKVVPNGCCLGRSPWTNLICASFPHPLSVRNGYSMLKVPAQCSQMTRPDTQARDNTGEKNVGEDLSVENQPQLPRPTRLIFADVVCRRNPFHLQRDCQRFRRRCDSFAASLLLESRTTFRSGTKPVLIR